ncbi:MAG: hypothetical protein ACRDST_00015 [Pseudonocardiaceae bacterium]
MAERGLIPMPVLGIALAGAVSIPATGTTGSTPAAHPAASRTSVAWLSTRRVDRRYLRFFGEPA